MLWDIIFRRNSLNLCILDSLILMFYITQNILYAHAQKIEIQKNGLDYEKTLTKTKEMDK